LIRTTTTQPLLSPFLSSCRAVELSSLFKTSTYNAGMKRSFIRTKLARASIIQPRRSLIQSLPKRSPELAYSTSTDVEALTPPLRRETPPFRFETGIALFAKRLPRPFPPPFLSPPSGSFSDPLSTHHRSRDRRAYVNGDLIRGCTNGDDAVYVSERFICANDGVGAWSTRPGGHAGFVFFKPRGNHAKTSHAGFGRD
jgi:protein phosphatase PTC7